MNFHGLGIDYKTNKKNIFQLIITFGWKEVRERFAIRFVYEEEALPRINISDSIWEYRIWHMGKL